MIKALLKKLPRASLRDRVKRDRVSNRWLQPLMVTSFVVSALVLGAREVKWLQPWELGLYDQMLRSRPLEPSDKRILLVEVTEEDLQQQKTTILPDRTVSKLLGKLESYQPRAIALNMFRNTPVPPGEKELATQLSSAKNIITVCKFSENNSKETPPSPYVPLERVGFSDLISDESDKIVRRALLFATSGDEKCKTSFSFGALAAFGYLQKEPQSINFKFVGIRDFILGHNFVSTLRNDSGSYENLDNLGYQILINYRNSPQSFERVSVTDVLNGSVNANQVKNRLVMIGVTANGIEAGLYTPYSGGNVQGTRTPALYIHAQIASQLISTALDSRNLIWYWSNWQEILWVWVWSVGGAGIAWYFRHPLRLGLAGGISLGALTLIGYLLFLQAGWIPVIPPALGLVLSGASIMAYNSYRMGKETQVFLQQLQQQDEAIAQLNSLIKENAIRDRVVDTPTPEDTKADTSKQPGNSLLSDRYKIVRVLGSGGFGHTYLAEDTQRPGKPICVVKQLMPARTDTRFMQVARRLFDAEAEILEVLGNHSQIPQLLAYFEEDDEFYLIEEYIEGKPLSDELQAYRSKHDEAYVVSMLKDILEALAFVHEHRVIHRDIKPANIIRRKKDNRLVLIDFGAVKSMQPPSEQTELATVAIGTRGYAPAEQFAGHPRLASDIYAVGMIGIQALTGIPPHDIVTDANTGNPIWQGQVQVSTDLAEILDKMVCYHFSDRYQSATEALEDLRKLAPSF